MSFSRKNSMYYLFGFILCFLGSCSAKPSFDIQIEESVRLGLSSNGKPVLESKIISFDDSKQKLLVWYQSKNFADLNEATNELIEWDIQAEQPKSLYLFTSETKRNELLDIQMQHTTKQVALVYKNEVFNPNFSRSFTVKLVDLSMTPIEKTIYTSTQNTSSNLNQQATFAQSEGFLFLTSQSSSGFGPPIPSTLRIIRLSDQQEQVFNLDDLSKTISWSGYLSKPIQLIATKDAKKLFWLHSNKTKILTLSFDPVSFKLTIDKEIDISRQGPLVSMTFRNSDLVTAHFQEKQFYKLVRWNQSLSEATELFSISNPDRNPYTEISFSEDGSLLAVKSKQHQIQLWNPANASFLSTWLGGHLSPLEGIIPITANQIIVRNAWGSPPYLWEWKSSQIRPHLSKEFPFLSAPSVGLADNWNVPGPFGEQALFRNDSVHLLYPKNEQTQFLTLPTQSLIEDYGKPRYDWHPLYFASSLQDQRPLLLIETKQGKIYRYFVDIQKQTFVKDQNFALEREIESSESRYSSVTLSPSQQCLAINPFSYDYIIEKTVGTLDILCQGSHLIQAKVTVGDLLWSPLGQFIFATTGDGFGVFDLFTSKLSIRRFNQIPLSGDQIVISANWINENVLLTVQRDGTITIWDVPTGEILAQNQVNISFSDFAYPNVSFLDTATGKVLFFIPAKENNMVIRVFINQQ